MHLPLSIPLAHYIQHIMKERDAQAEYLSLIATALQNI